MRKRVEETSVPLKKRASLASVVLNTLSVGVMPFLNVHLILHNTILWSYFNCYKCEDCIFCVGVHRESIK